MPGHGDTPVSAIAPLCPQRHHDARLVPAEARPCTRMLRNLKITNCRPLNPLRRCREIAGRKRSAVMHYPDLSCGSQRAEWCSATRPSIIQPSGASGSVPSHTPSGLADGGSGHADTGNSCPKRATAERDLRNHLLRLRKRGGRHRLRRCCDGKGKGSNSNQPSHFFSSFCLWTPRAETESWLRDHAVKESITRAKVLDLHQIGTTIATDTA